MRTIRCWRFRSRLTSYVDNEASPDERLSLEQHLGRCAACRDRVRREQAVRRRLRLWSAEMRDEGAPLSWPATAEASSPHRANILVGIGAFFIATVVLVMVMWNRWPAGVGMTLSARGQITDSRCASDHSHGASALRNMSGRDCVRRCIEMGAQYVFVTEDVVYVIRNQDFADLMHLAGQDVELEGEVQQNLLTVSHVRVLTARRPNNDSYSKNMRAS